MPQKTASHPAPVAYAIALTLVGLQTLWLIGWSLAFQAYRLGLWEGEFIQTAATATTLYDSILVTGFGYLYVGGVWASLAGLVLKRRWAFWTYLAGLLGHAMVWIQLTGIPTTQSAITLAFIVMESGTLMLIQYLVNAPRLNR